MTHDVMKGAVRFVLDGGLVSQRLSIVWHAGEPLVLPVSYYMEAFAAIEEEVRGRCEVSHSFQTNGTLISDSWCEFMKTQNMRIGLSIDGPAFLHDHHRKTRYGEPTHEQTMRGVEKLKEHEIPFHVIAVVTAAGLDHAEAIFRFFEGLGVRELGFNVEELEGDHIFSSLAGDLTMGKIENFWKQLYELYESCGAAFQIREFERATRAILMPQEKRTLQELATQNDQIVPFRILSVDCQGRLSTFSPELLGVHDEYYGDFIFGQVQMHDLATVRASQQFQRAVNDVMQGVRECSRTCEYFSVCGGGAPSNKYFENKSLSSTTTMYCRSSIQLPVDVVLSRLENKLNIGSSGG